MDSVDLKHDSAEEDASADRGRIQRESREVHTVAEVDRRTMAEGTAKSEEPMQQVRQDVQGAPSLHCGLQFF